MAQRRSCGITLRRFVEFGFSRLVRGGLTPGEVAHVKITEPIGAQISNWLHDSSVIVVPPQQTALAEVRVGDDALSAVVAVFVVADRQEMAQTLYS